MDNLEFLDAGEPAIGEAQPAEPTVAEAPAEAVAPEPQAEPVAEAPKGPQRGADGKFVAKEPVAEPKATVPEGYVPVAALQELRAEIKALKAAPQPEVAPEPVPDVLDNPEGYTSWQQQQILNVSLNFSERLAVKEHGKESVEAAKQWAMQKAQSNPSYAAEFMGDPDPYDKIVTDWKRDSALTKIGDPSRIEAFLAWEAAQAAIQQPAVPTVQQPLPTPSIAADASAGGVAHQPTGPGIAFDATIGR